MGGGVRVVQRGGLGVVERKRFTKLPMLMEAEMK